MNPVNFSKKLQLARQFMQLQQPAEALALYAKVVREFPQAALWNEFGRAAAAAGDFHRAVQIWDKARSLEPDNAELLAELAREHQNIRLHARARALYSESAALAPGNLEAQLRLAWLLSRTGEVETARTAVNRCRELDAQNEQVRYLIAHLNRGDNQLPEAEQQFRELIASVPQEVHIRYSCHSELAQILDQTGRFEEAMVQLEEGKHFLRAAMKSGADDTSVDEWHEEQTRKNRQLPKNILEIWGKSFLPRTRSAAPPIAFLTGSARSGTTLLERILDAHPSVTATDEALAFQTIQPLIDVTRPAIPPSQLNSLRQRYEKNLEIVAPPTNRNNLRLDKNPSKTEWLPAFLRVFPELRVLIALRDPRDVVISLFFQNQSRTNALSFERLARYYRNVMEMWLTVREWEGLVWRETRYEEVVNDLSGEGGGVTRFLGLEWHENQARFFEKNREKPVMSSNYGSVTKPVYHRSVGRWRAYEKHLAPILPVLEPYCRRFGYA